MTPLSTSEQHAKGECVRDRDGIWHIPSGPADAEATFRPILCGEKGVGLVMPGPGYTRQPTCPECKQRRRA